MAIEIEREQFQSLDNSLSSVMSSVEKLEVELSEADLGYMLKEIVKPLDEINERQNSITVYLEKINERQKDMDIGFAHMFTRVADVLDASNEKLELINRRVGFGLGTILTVLIAILGVLIWKLK